MWRCLAQLKWTLDLRWAELCWAHDWCWLAQLDWTLDLRWAELCWAPH